MALADVALGAPFRRHDTSGPWPHLNRKIEVNLGRRLSFASKVCITNVSNATVPSLCDYPKFPSTRALVAIDGSCYYRASHGNSNRGTFGLAEEARSTANSSCGHCIFIRERIFI